MARNAEPARHAYTGAGPAPHDRRGGPAMGAAAAWAWPTVHARARCHSCVRACVRAAARPPRGGSPATRRSRHASTGWNDRDTPRWRHCPVVPALPPPAPPWRPHHPAPALRPAPRAPRAAQHARRSARTRFSHSARAARATRSPAARALPPPAPACHPAPAPRLSLAPSDFVSSRPLLPLTPCL